MPPVHTVPEVAPRPFSLRLATAVRFGDGELERVAELVENAQAQRWFVVAGRASAQRDGRMQRLLEQLGPRAVPFPGVPANPELEVFEAALAAARAAEPTAVAAVGGGSVLDVAKVTAFLSRRAGTVAEHLAGRSAGPQPGLPLLAVPTTAGTGSEVTRWATVWDRSACVKRSLDHRSMAPRWAIVDPALTATLSPELRIITALDALSHACEACWGRASQPYSRLLATRAIRLIHDTLPAALGEPTHARLARLGLASLLAGLAFAQTRTALAHSISYPLTLRFGVPHGLAAALPLPGLLRFNRRASPAGVRAILRGVRAHSIAEGVAALERLIRCGPVAVHLRDYGVADADLPVLAAEALENARAGNNPRPARSQDVVSVLRQVL